METMAPKQDTMGQNRSESLSRDSKPSPDNKKKMKTLAQRRQSAPSLVISKALTRSRSASRESCLTPVSPESCPLVQAFLAEGPGRAFLGHAHIQLKTGLQTQDRHLFLFTDTLLVTKAKSPTHFKVKAQVRVCEMWTASCMEEVCEGSTNPERSFVVGWPTCNSVATFSSEELKDKWLALISSRIADGKQRDDPQTVPLKIFAKDIGNCAYAKTLAVSNTDSTTDVIHMALQQFGISGCVKDHRLWVSSCKDDPPYPLIGHEFPFSIKMSHIRDGGGSPGGGQGGGAPGRELASPSDCPGVLLLDQCLPPETQCQFILRPNKAVLTPPQLLEPGQQKPFKRKRSLINWPFWRGSNPQLDGPPLSPTLLHPPQGRLFGLPLSSVCCPGLSLPKPVMDLLVFLYLEGPYTRGIFRRSAGAKACRELRDRLDGGAEDAEVAHQSAFVIAAVLKDFLRNIPGSVLCVDLFHQWMEVMEGDGGEQRITAVQRLLSLLPGENLLLLRHVVAVLHRIQGNAHDNQMNAFNLSVCIAPSMLWPPAPSSPEMEGEATKKVCELVRFLIENCVCVLGDGASLFRAFSQKSSGSDHGSDVSSFQMNDSSYDSLENELNDDPESPFREQLPLRDKDKPDSCSRDSVITLSDGEPDGVGADDGGGGLLQLPPLSRQRRFSPAVRQPRGSSSSQGPRRLRRSSEPALALAGTPSPNVAMASGAAASHPPARKASYDAAMEGEEEEEEDEVFVEQGLARLQLQGAGPDGRQKKASRPQNGVRRKAKPAPPPPLRLDASCSSLSSPATSPTGSSLSSLDSAFSQYSTDYAVPPQSPRNSPPHWPPPPAVANGNGNANGNTNAAIAPPHHTHGLHPNTWLKRERGLSLKQAHAEDPPMGNGQNGHAPPATAAAAQDGVRPRSSSPPSYQQALLQLQGGRSPFFRGGDKPLTVRDLRQAHGHTPPPPRGVFFGQNCTTLVLHRPKSHSLTPGGARGGGAGTLPPRRASEPPSLTPGRRPDDPPGAQRPCLSPSATCAVRDYFSSQGRAEADRRSREVACAVAQSNKQWQSRRCSDPRVEDFEQLFFAEESYV